MNIPLSTFPAPLLRRILCGGGGLPTAWGPIADADGALCSWHPHRGEVFVSGDYTTTDPTLDAGSWSLPLDDDSPWPARLAMVAAWISYRDLPVIGTAVVSGERGINIGIVRLTLDPLPSDTFISWWSKTTGHAARRSCFWSDGEWCATDIDAPDLPSLPTLPQHLQTHPPAVALLLALHDVPEIRARVESA